MTDKHVPLPQDAIALNLPEKFARHTTIRLIESLVFIHAIADVASEHIHTEEELDELLALIMQTCARARIADYADLDEARNVISGNPP